MATAALVIKFLIVNTPTFIALLERHVAWLKARQLENALETNKTAIQNAQTQPWSCPLGNRCPLNPACVRDTTTLPADGAAAVEA